MSQGMMEPYAGLISFLRMPFAPSAEGLDIAVMGVPFDLATTGRSGARFGPRGVREMSLTMAEFPWGVWPWEYHFRDEFKVADLGDVTGFTAYTDRMMPCVEEAADKVLATGAQLLTIGGDHSISYPLLRAHARKHGPLALIHFDAHSDTWTDEDLNHGTMFYHAIKEGIIVPENSIQLGMRTPNPDKHGMLVHDGLECLRTPAAEMAERIRARVGDRPAYLTFDIDFLDPAYAPATGTPVVGGPNVAYARDVLRALRGMNIVGGDQVEVAPHYEGPGQITALAGATIACDILYLIAEARKQRG
ncbi:agmatinase [Kordiimonas gwangyangensis]|uniref:agmatinase n=1 Tax=Kordiimonas gwangyangensis TaxID=288022 RepID=UPI00039DAC18|nr:agmatinase [Kordiimonas gwangyangensis]